MAAGQIAPPPPGFELVPESGGEPPPPPPGFEMVGGGKTVDKPDSFLSRVGHGIMDPIYGGAQAVAHGNVGPTKKNELPGQRQARESQERIRTRLDTAIQEREKAYSPPEGIDVGRALGNVVGASPLAAVAGPLVGGTIAGATQPVVDTKNFGTEKTLQVGVGAATGGLLAGAGKIASAGMKALGNYLASEFPENVMTAAVQKILKRMGQDEKSGGASAKDAIDLINEASKKGKPMTLADVGGENVRALAGNVARQPGESRNITKQFLEQRDQGAAQRLQGDISRYVHGGASMHQTAGALLEARSVAAKPAYEQMRAMEGVWSPRLQQFIDDPLIRRGMARGYEIERGESLAENRPFDPTQMGVNLDAEGNIQIIRAPNMRVLDMGKQGLDAMIADERNEITGRLNSRGVMLEKVRKAYLDEIDKMDRDGVYRAARETWSGPTRSFDAIRMGRGVFTNSPEQNAAEFAKLSRADQEFSRVGVADILREKLAKTGLSGDEAKALIKNPWMRDQLRPYFPSEADFNGFVDSVTAETKMFGTKFDVLGGSQTAKRLAEDESHENRVAAEAMNLGVQVATGRPHSAIHTAIRMWRDRQDRRGNPKLNEQISKILFQTPIDPGSEVAQRLTGTYKGPPPINRLTPYGEAIERGASALAPGAASALAPGQ